MRFILTMKEKILKYILFEFKLFYCYLKYDIHIYNN